MVACDPSHRPTIKPTDNGNLSKKLGRSFWDINRYSCWVGNLFTYISNNLPFHLFSLLHLSDNDDDDDEDDDDDDDDDDYDEDFGSASKKRRTTRNAKVKRSGTNKYV